MTEQPQGSILYVDDDEVNRHACAWLFREAGFEVLEAATGRDALRLAVAKPDLVILDVNLPDINGFEVCRRIKAHAATTAIPVLHLSAVYVKPEDRTRALEGGADCYLTKPVEPRELVAQAKALLRIHQADERARAASRQWQATFDAIHDGVCLLDRHGRVLRCNRAAARILQRPPFLILGRPCHELTPAAPGAGVAPAFARMLETLDREVMEVPLGQRWLHVVADPLLDPDGTLAGAVYVLSDITDRKHLEEQLRQSQQLDAMARLAAGVVHDFNNLLTALSGHVSLLLARKPEPHPERDRLLAMEQAVCRAAGLTEQLRGFSRQTPVRPVPTNLRSCLEEAVALLRPTLDPRITVEVGGDPEPWTVQADPGQINRVLLNLCLNARDAMPRGGRLLLEAENAVLDEDQARHPEARAGEFVRLRVRDTGLGIPADILPRIFEPFFTTKPAGAGTGLGLATVYGIVRQHRGWIECSSVLGQGTCFDVYLPRVQEAQAVAASVPAAPPRRSETILLLDGEAVARTLGRSILRRSGYEVLVAEDAQQAVSTYQREKGRIALVILDLTPDSPGPDVLRRLLEIDPEVRVLAAGGQPAGQGTEARTERVLGSVKKPYCEQDLAASVRQVLDRASPGHTRESAELPVRPLPPPGPTQAGGTPRQEVSRDPGAFGRPGLTKRVGDGVPTVCAAAGLAGPSAQARAAGALRTVS
jgi:PAS domain S-box-containing protein